MLSKSMVVNRGSDPYMSSLLCAERLLKEYEAYGNLVVAFDFDNTIYDFHKDGIVYPVVIELLRECKEIGLTLVCYTGNMNTELVTKYCADNLISFDYLNESPITSVSAQHKPYFSILLDDRSGLGSAYITLQIVVEHIKGGKNA